MNDQVDYPSNVPPLTYDEMEDQRDTADALLAHVLSLRGENVPVAMVRRMSDGESPVRVWREHRGMTVASLAAAAALGESDLAAVERGTVELGLSVVARIAKALGVEVDELVPWPQD
jgi:DNA-binding XRE family transcriptional regulator